MSPLTKTDPNSTNTITFTPKSVWKSYLSRFLHLRFTPGFGFLSIFIVEVCAYTSSYLHPNDWTYILHLGKSESCSLLCFCPQQKPPGLEKMKFKKGEVKSFLFKNHQKPDQKPFSKQFKGPFSDIFQEVLVVQALRLGKTSFQQKKKTTKGVQNKWHKHVNLSYLTKHTTCQIASFHVLQAHILISCPGDI